MEKKIIPNKEKKILTGGEMINYHRRQTLKKYSKRKICTYKEIEREREMERHGYIYIYIYRERERGEKERERESL